MLALDLDGTVLTADLKLDPRDVEALDRARAAGVFVVAVTGRPFPGALPWVERMHLPGPIVCYQGAQIRGLDGEMMLDHGVDHEVAAEVIRFARERDLHVQTYSDDRLLVERDRPEAHEYSEHAGMPINLVGDLAQATGPTTPKVVIVAAKAVIENLLPEIRTRFRGRLNAATSMPTYLEMTSPRADKRLALEHLCGLLGITAEQAVAVGDGRNDIPMIEWAGLGVAVEGAAAEVMKSASQVVARPGEAGIARLVNELLHS